MKISLSNIVTAFNAATVGTKVLQPSTFMEALVEAVSAYEMPSNGQGFVPMPASVFPMVSCGVARLCDLQDGDLIQRTWRDERCIFARRRRGNTLVSPPVAQVNCVVYTVDAYYSDPQVGAWERGKLRGEHATHVLVAVLASADDPKPTVSERRFLHNICGGNSRYLDSENTPMSDTEWKRRVREDAADVLEYTREWITVCDVEVA